jgi:hypothetical protein
MFDQFSPIFFPFFSIFQQLNHVFPRFPTGPTTFSRGILPRQVLHDALPLTALDPKEQVFAVVARETKVELLLQAAGGVEKGW